MPIGQLLETFHPSLTGLRRNHVIWGGAPGGVFYLCAFVFIAAVGYEMREPKLIMADEEVLSYESL
jgi:hypothetical protein